MLNSKPIGKTTEYRGKTLQGLLVTISGFFKWCAKKKYREPRAGRPENYW